MKQSFSVPQPTIERLPLYYRYLDRVSNLEGKNTITSTELGEKLNILGNQVRRDLLYFGEFGQKGVGYNVEKLKRSIKKIIGLNKKWKAIIVGTGNLGSALINFKILKKMSLEIVRIYDNDLNKIGYNVDSKVVHNIKQLDSQFIENEDIKLGIITVPGEVAQEIADKLISVGIKGIWNFAPVKIKVSEDILIRIEDLSVGLGSLIYNLNRSEKEID